MLKLAALKALLTEIGRIWGEKYSWLRVWLVVLGPEASHHLFTPHIFGANLDIQHLHSGKHRESQDKVSPPASLHCLVTEHPVSPGFPVFIGKVKESRLQPEPKQERTAWADLISTSLLRLWRYTGWDGFFPCLISSHHEELRDNMDFLLLRVSQYFN